MTFPQQPQQPPYGQQFPQPGPAQNPFPPLPPQKGLPAKLQRLSEMARDPKGRKKLILRVLLAIVAVVILIVGVIFLVGVVIAPAIDHLTN
ncbi:hypothetical protein SAMN04489729_5076 [Amycolatopsis lurida]|uniref:Uncharacterized protein n=1 Tax=Amycolatopsis lurida NRRL 2430 TaxID=1460371 RepID=A0A2P2FQS0_AMYLU|nr:hypothetical protein [Amycolatopsis lurida]KFU79068.1 hypothetical protein BB31_22285 [Amycolatopsis lurida NRRL 2430]SED73044.1 hypothetical protein SAMN04489729_5076 [Amycolatopsis lurida]